MLFEQTAQRCGREAGPLVLRVDDEFRRIDGGRTQHRVALEQEVNAGSGGPVLVTGAGRDWPTAQEAVLKLREGARIPAEAYETEQLLHGYLAAIDESVRAFVLEGEGLAAERAAAAAAALQELGCDVDLLPTRHPVVDIVLFQRLTVEIAESRGREPDCVRTIRNGYVCNVSFGVKTAVKSRAPSRIGIWYSCLV